MMQAPAVAAAMGVLLAIRLQLPLGAPTSTSLECTTAAHQHRAYLQWCVIAVQLVSSWSMSFTVRMSVSCAHCYI